jgi:hypothetical protein
VGVYGGIAGKEGFERRHRADQTTTRHLLKAKDMFILYWAIAILAAAFFWWLIKKTSIVGFIITWLFPKSYWEPPVDPYQHDEYDMYD